MHKAAPTESFYGSSKNGKKPMLFSFFLHRGDMIFLKCNTVDGISKKGNYQTKITETEKSGSYSPK